MVRAHLLGGDDTPEHRTAAVAFLQFSGLDELIEAAGTEVAADHLDRLVRLVQSAAERYEVCFLDSDIAPSGGKIRLSAGAPRAVGEDEERIVLALREVIESDLPLPVQIGVHWGPVFSGEVGPAYRRWYAVMGDTVNLAARLMASAPPGHIYATRELLLRTKTRFEQTPLEPFCVKGKSHRVHAGDVGPPLRAGDGGGGRAQLPLVGRERELDRLRDAIEGARRARGTLIELTGETGTGKSRLLREARSSGRGNDRAARDVRGLFARDAVRGVAGPSASGARPGLG